MSHHSDDGMLTPTSDSFWEPGNYKKTTKRIEDSFRLCNDLMLLVQERSDIEKAYGKSLKVWAKRWNEAIEKGPEYGTTEAAWKGALVEADRRCELHVKVRDRLLSEVQADIKQWQKDNYHKSMMQLKEKKEMDDLFKKAQKPWAKILAKVNKAKSDYHTACKNERTATMQERNATSDSSISPDQIKKLQDRAQKCKEEVQKTRERFEASLQEINGYNAKYMEDMMQVFDKCQEMEEKRLKFFKRMLFNMHDCLNLANYQELPQMYEEYRHTIQNADSAKDLKWWSHNHGVGMAMNWPQFEEYSEEFRDIAGKSGNKRTNVADSSIMLLNQRPVGDEIPECGPDSKKSSRSEASVKSGVSINNRGDKNKDKDSQRASVVSLNRQSYNPFEEDTTKAHNEENLQMPGEEEEEDKNGKQDRNPFDDDQDEWDEDPNDPLVDNGEPGVPVKALYDYEGAEGDELTFKQGEVFEKLEDEDEQGWCKGRKDGRVGLYPANYVESVH